MRYSQDEIRRFAKGGSHHEGWTQRHHWSQIQRRVSRAQQDKNRCTEKLPAAISTGRMQQQRRREREGDLVLLHCAPRQDLPVTACHVTVFSLAEEDQKSRQTDSRSSPSPQPNALASQQPSYMTLFMDVIGFESCSQPLGGILSESGAFA